MSDVENRPSGQYRWRNNNVVWKTGMTRPPCNDGEHDCPNRRVGCRSGCEAWKAWEKLHAEEREALQKKRMSNMDADDFMVERGKRRRSLTMTRYRERRDR